MEARRLLLRFLPREDGVGDATSAPVRAVVRIPRPLPIHVAATLVDHLLAGDPRLVCPVSHEHICTMSVVYAGTCQHVVSAGAYLSWMATDLGRGRCTVCESQEGWTAVARTPKAPPPARDDSDVTPAEAGFARADGYQTPSVGDATSGDAAVLIAAGSGQRPAELDQPSATLPSNAVEARAAAGTGSKAGKPTVSGSLPLQSAAARRARGGVSMEEGLARRGPLVKAAFAAAQSDIRAQWAQDARPHALAAGFVEFSVHSRTASGQAASMSVLFWTAADPRLVREGFDLLPQNEVTSELVAAASELGPEKTLEVLKRIVSLALRCSSLHAQSHASSSRTCHRHLTSSGASYGTPPSLETLANRRKALE